MWVSMLERYVGNEGGVLEIAGSCNVAVEKGKMGVEIMQK